MSDSPENLNLNMDAAVVPPHGPGVLLRKAREEKGLDIDDVVQAIKFSARQIEAVEADHLEMLPGTVFVRGIVRSYSRFLKLDPEPLLALLNSEVPVVPPDVRPPDNMGTAMPKTGVHQIPLLVALSILLLIGAATMAAWHFLAPMPAATPVVTPEPALEEAPAGTPVVVPQPRVEIPAESTEVAPAVPASEMAVIDQHQLIFEFRGKSWVEVKDGSQRTIMTGQYDAGAREVAVGKPPFQLVVGNAAEVALQYDDRSVDLKPFTRAEVARLTLE